MNRNVNMTGNFSNMNGRGLKPGDLAFNSKKTGNFRIEQFTKNYTGPNTNSNFSHRPNNTGFNNMNNNNFNFKDSEVSEAKESLKLLKMKMGNNFGSLGNSGTSGNYGVQKNYENNQNIINTGSYRKPFKPNFNDTNDNNPIQVETNKKVTGGVNRNTNVVRKNNANNPTGNNKLNSYNQKPITYEEVDDDRPAFPQGQNKFDDEENGDDQENEDYEGADRMECPTCKRKFNPESYQKHAKNCKKVFVNKRKQFDSKKKRVINSEHAMLLKHSEIEEKKKGKMNPNNLNTKKNKWKKQSEELRAILKANRTVTAGFGNNNQNNKNFEDNMNKRRTGTGANYNNKGSMGYVNNNPSVLTEDYKLCNMCTRKYNEQAYAKHLPTCERRTKEAMLKGKMTSGVGSNTTNAYGNKPNLNVRFKK